MSRTEESGLRRGWARKEKRGENCMKGQKMQKWGSFGGVLAGVRERSDLDFGTWVPKSPMKDFTDLQKLDQPLVVKGLNNHLLK